MENVDIRLLREIADLETTPQGAYNIRKNGELASRNTTANIDIVSKTDKPGIDIYIKDGTKHQSVHIPVLITQTGLDDLVYNDFHIGADCDVVIVAGCGIHNEGSQETKHDGVHTFYIGENSRVQYVEKHYGEGEGTGERVMNPRTEVYLEKGAFLQMDTTQLRGVDSTKRYTKVVVKEDAEAVVTEKLLTHGKQEAESEMDVILAGEGARGRVISRSVAQDESHQIFYPRMIGDAAGFGHVQCDSIIMGKSRIESIPALTANHPDAQLIHEAAIGRIAGDQMLKLMTLGLTEEEAEEKFSMDFLDERAGLPTPEKEGIYYIKQDPDLGENPRPGPLGGGERHPPHPHGGRRRRGDHDDPPEQPAAVRHRPRGGCWWPLPIPSPATAWCPYGKVCVTQGSTVNFLRPAAGAYLFCRATPVKVGSRICVVSVEQRNDRDELITTRPVHLRGGADHRPGDPAPPKHPNLTF